jgi:hypothetical protein
MQGNSCRNISGSAATFSSISVPFLGGVCVCGFHMLDQSCCVFCGR